MTKRDPVKPGMDLSTRREVAGFVFCFAPVVELPDDLDRKVRDRFARSGEVDDGGSIDRDLGNLRKQG